MTKITKEALIEAGFDEYPDDPFMPFKKKLKTDHPISDEEDSSVVMVISRMYDSQHGAVALLFPGGEALYLKAESMEDIKKLEGMVDFFDPCY